MKSSSGFTLSPDGTRIAYTVEGEGPAIVLTAGLTTTRNFWKYVRPRWARRYTVVTWDYPGHGLSDPARTPRDATIEAQPAILAKVMDAVGIERATQVGFSVGCQVVLEMARRFPERCEALVTLLGTPGRVLDHFEPPLSTRTVRRLIHMPEVAFVPVFNALTRRAWTPLTPFAAHRIGLVGPRLATEDLREIAEHLKQLDARTVRSMAISAQEHSAHDLLPTLRLPLLIVAGHADPFAPARKVGIPMHEAAPGSELVELPTGTHAALLEEPEAIGDAVERFVTRHLGRAALAS